MPSKASNYAVDVTAYSPNVFSGRPMKVDVFSVTQEDTSTISYMTQALGLMSELDLGTENWRWMGDTRYFLGFLRGREFRTPHITDLKLTALSYRI